VLFESVSIYGKLHRSIRAFKEYIEKFPEEAIHNFLQSDLEKVEASQVD